MDQLLALLGVKKITMLVAAFFGAVLSLKFVEGNIKWPQRIIYVSPLISDLIKASEGLVLTEFDNPFDNYDMLHRVGLAGEKDKHGFFLFPLQARLAAHEGAMWQMHLRHVLLLTSRHHN